MKRILAGSGLTIMMTVLLTLSAANVFAAAKGPEIQIIDGKVSIQAESMKLSQFLHLLDEATGMTSTVNPTLANEKITVRLEGLDLNAAIRKSFQGQPYNYVVTEGKGIRIIDRASTIAAPSGGSSSIQPFNESRPIDNSNPPPPVPPSALSQPTPAAAAPGATPSQPAGAVNLPPAQGGGTTAPPPLFPTIGTPLGTALPGASPAR